jgi:hypothetical protein
MTLKKLIMTAAILAGATLAATTAGLAQGYYGGPYGRGYYDYSPGWGAGLYDYGGGPYNYGPAIPNVDRGGPGPRVQAGSGMGIGAER